MAGNVQDPTRPGAGGSAVTQGPSAARLPVAAQYPLEASHGVFTNAYCEMLIGLFLVFLVFVILLDALAVNARSKLTPPVPESATTNEAVSLVASGPLSDDPDGNVQGLAALKQSLQRTFPNSEISISSQENTMEVGLPQDSMFDQGSSQMKSVESTLDRVMTTLLGRNVGRVVLTAFFCTRPDADLHGASERGRALVQALAARGVPYDKLFIGLRPCEGDKISLQFKVVYDG